MDTIIQLVYSGTQFMYQIIYSNDFFFIDYWTINHIWSGAFLMLILTAMGTKHKWIVFTGLIILWEAAEIMFRIFAVNLFSPEIIKDQVIDVLIGILGGLVCSVYLSINERKSKPKQENQISIIAALSASYSVSFAFLGMLIGSNGRGFDYELFNILLYFLFTPLLYFSIYLNQRLITLKLSVIISTSVSTVMSTIGLYLLSELIFSISFEPFQVIILAVLHSIAFFFYLLIVRLKKKSISNMILN